MDEGQSNVQATFRPNQRSPTVYHLLLAYLKLYNPSSDIDDRTLDNLNLTNKRIKMAQNIEPRKNSHIEGESQ